MSKIIIPLYTQVLKIAYFYNLYDFNKLNLIINTFIILNFFSLNYFILSFILTRLITLKLYDKY